jgi:hypothetical protein
MVLGAGMHQSGTPEACHSPAGQQSDTHLGCALQATSGHTLTLGFRVPREQCYSPSDLRLGGYISVHGRDFLLHDCDAFTREWWVPAACWASCS